MAQVTVDYDGPRHIWITWSHEATDSTELTDSIIVNKSSYTGPDGTEVGRLVVEEIISDIQGYNFCKVEFDHTTDDEIVTLGAGQNYYDYRDFSGKVDPNTTGGTGDVVVTTDGAADGASASITIRCRKKD